MSTNMAAHTAVMAENIEPRRSDYCCVPHCNGNAKLHKDLSFHRFPSEKKEDLRKRWIIAIRRDEGPDFKIQKWTVLCSRHFTEKDFRWTVSRRCLRPQAVPSVFDWTQAGSTRKPPAVRHSRPLQELHSTSSTLNSNTTYTMDDEPSETDAVTECSEPEDPTLVCGSTNSGTCIANLKERLLEKELELRAKEEEIKRLKHRVELERFGITRFTFDNNMIEFYTGFPTYDVFIGFYSAIKPTASRIKSVYYTYQPESNCKGRPKSMDPIDELFLFLCRLKCGFLSEDLAVRFNIHASSVSRKVITWANFLYFFLGSLSIWPSKENIVQHMPRDFQLLYPNTRIIIDCTEIFTERPSSIALASKTFSSYKSHNTWKGLVGIAPHGAVTFISPLYSGCMSDIEITRQSGLLDLLERGDEIMADKGFVLNKLLHGTGIKITTPHFLCSDGQFSPYQVEDNQRVASFRIHVERHIKRVKEYRLLQTTVPLSIAGTINQMWTVANLLTLFKRPLIKTH
ncbi:uncharacterized protein [Argopecten irradians]|uniref:uncharacterized protein n=1 Tax=Argopecten irradians TaxID=31199 RepID=UPI003721A496